MSTANSRDIFPMLADDPNPGLTVAEVACIRQAGALAGMLAAIVGDGKTRAADLNELIAHVHAIQQAVMSQAAGRAYPDHFRLLGEVLPGD
jgi:hypothetical protein